MATPTSESPWTFSADSGQTNIDALLGGTQWAAATVTYSFPSGGATWSTQTFYGYGPSSGSGEPWSDEFDGLATSDQQATRDIFDDWAAVIDLNLVESVDNANTVGDIRLAYTYGDDIADAQAYAYSPGSGTIAGDIWFNARGTSYTDLWSAGSYVYMTTMHEVGHALGLKHPFEGQVVLDPSLDSRSFTIMSYSAAPGDTSTYFTFEPTTPMVLDIAAIQFLYGANTAHRTGNDTYTFTGTGEYHETIWDAGGTDTLVYSATAGGVLDLTAGTTGGSRLGQSVFVINSFGQNLYAVDNLWIATGTVIENAAGGSGSDQIIGNAVANRLLGSNGNDTLTGASGNDTLDGGAGTDSMNGGSGNDIYTADRTTDVITETGAGTTELDTVKASVNWTLGNNLEKLTLTGTAAVNGTGNSLANTITGNAAANRLNGATGADTLIGGLGNDAYTVNSSFDVITEAGTAVSEIDSVSSSVSWTLGANLENLTLTGANAINGTGNALANEITGNAGANALIGSGGADTLVGGLGSDTYTVTSTFDVIIEAGTAAGEIDLVKSSVTWKLGDNLEELTLTGSNAVNATGNTAANAIVGNAGVNTLTGGAGADTLTGGGGADVFVINSSATSDLITDFLRATDDLRINQGAIAIGDGDTLVEGSRTLAGPGGFAVSAELVVVTANISGGITVGRAAAVIGSATSAYAVGDTRLFVVDNGVDSALYLFTAANANALVSASELQLLATLQGTASVAATDIVFGP